MTFASQPLSDCDIGTHPLTESEIFPEKLPVVMDR